MKTGQCVSPAARAWTAMPAFMGALSFICGIVAYGLFSRLWTLSLYNGVFIAAIIFSFLASISAKNLFLRILPLMLAGFLAAAYHASADKAAFERLAAAGFVTSASCECDARLVSPPITSGKSSAYIVSVDTLYTSAGRVTPGAMRFYCKSKTAPTSPRLKLYGVLRIPESAKNPGAYDDRLSMRARGLWGRIQVDSLVERPGRSMGWHIASNFRKRASKAFSRARNPRNEAIMHAAFLGEKHLLTHETREAFRRSGMYHLLAISGLHVTLLAACTLLCMRCLPIPRWLRISAAMAVLWAYALFIGFIPSLVRAVIMGTILLAGMLTQRKHHALNALGIAALCWLTSSPASLYTPGFQLSFGATFGIIILVPALSSVMRPSVKNTWVNLLVLPVVRLFTVSLAGFIATAPVLIYHFGSLTLTGMASNIVAVLLMTPVMTGIIAAVAFQHAAPALALPAVRITEFSLNGISALANTSSNLWGSFENIPTPPAAAVLVYATSVVAFAALHRDFRKRFYSHFGALMFAALPFALILAGNHPSCKITSFCAKTPITGIRFPNGKLWIVGLAPETHYRKPFRWIISPWIRSNRSFRIDALVVHSLEPNIVHDILPYLENSSLGRLIAIDSSCDMQTEQDLRSLLNEYRTKLEFAPPGARFIPSPRCTCAIQTDNDANAAISVSYKGARGWISTGNPQNSPISLALESSYDLLVQGSAVHIEHTAPKTSQNGAIAMDLPLESRR